MARLFVGAIRQQVPGSGGTIGTVLDFGFATLRTVEYSIEPVMEPTGKDVECSKVTLDVVGVVNRVAISTGKPAGQEGSVGLPGGDNLAFTMYNIRDFLRQPRLYIRFQVGSQVVLESPGRLEGGPPPLGRYLNCDVKGGPYPKRAAFTQFMGSKLALLSYRVETYVTYCTKFCLSHRWTQTNSIDDNYYTTRTTRGRASFRKDALHFTGGMADDFRINLPPAVPADMRRINVIVDQNSDGSEVEYNVVDKEVTYGLGENSEVLEITGTVTAGTDLPVKDLKSFLSRLNPFGGGATGPADVASRMASTIWGTAVPTNRTMGIVRATGRKDCERVNLLRAALYVLFDRLRPILNPGGAFTSGVIASLYATFNVDSEHAPFCEVKLEAFAAKVNFFARFLGGNIDAYMDISKRYVYTPASGGTGINFGPDMLAPAMPNDAETRGTQLTRMLAAELLSSDQTCTVPSDGLASEVSLNAILK